MKPIWAHAVLVGAGGFVGTLLPYGVGGILQRQLPHATFPYGTLVVNLLGCLVIGGLAGLIDTRQVFSPEARGFALIGVLGGFTTYSTFGYETFALVRDAEHLRAAANVALHVILGLAGVWLGYALAVTR